MPLPCVRLSAPSIAIVPFLALLLVSSGCAPAPKNLNEPEKSWKIVQQLNGAGKPEAAIAEAQRLLQTDPDDDGVLYWLADAYVDNGQTAAAEETFLRVVSLSQDPDWASGSHVQLGRIYLKGNNLRKALNHLDEALAIKPLWGDTYVNLGWTYVHLGRYRDALAVFEHLNANPGIERSRMFGFNLPYEGHRGKAFALLGLGRADEALAELDRAEAARENWFAYWDRTSVHYASGNHKKLQELYGERGYLGTEVKTSSDESGRTGVEIVKVHSGSPAERSGLEPGDIVLRVGDRTVSAFQEYLDAVQSQRPDEVVHLSLLRSGQPMQLNVEIGSLLKWHLQVVKKQSNIAPLLTRMEILEKVEAAEAEGDLREALQVCLDHLDAASVESDQDPVVEKAILIARRLDPPPAVPEEAVRHAARAETYLETAVGHAGFEKALKEFRAALRQAPWWADAWFNLGIAQKKSGDPTAAIRSLRNFLLAAPYDPAAPQVQREIYSLEVLVEWNASHGQWQGRWADGGSQFRAERDGDQIVFVFIRPDQGDLESGFRPGDIKFSGTIDGQRLRGKRVFRPTDENAIRCFGAVYEKDTTAELTDGGYSVAAHWQMSNYLTQSCRITSLEEQTQKYFRLP